MSTANLDAADLKGVLAGGLIREDVMDKIWDISKIPLPFTDLVGEETAESSYTEWTQDALAAPDTTNANVDGADASGNDAATGTRLGNHTQISDKVVRVSDRADAVTKIGRAKELAYQISRRQQELRRDVEAIALLNQASIADNGDAVAGKSGGLPAWLTSNDNFGAGGASGGFNTTTKVVDARTVSTNRRALSEANIRTVIESIYNNGGNPTVLMSVPSAIARFSQYLFAATTVAAIRSNVSQSAEDAAAIGAVNVYVSDFGTLRFIPNRLQQYHNDGSAATCADVFILDPAYLALRYLQRYQTKTLARTGTAENRQITVDWTLVVHTEKAHGLVADINTATAATA
jgi:hypothetical protein